MTIAEVLQKAVEGGYHINGSDGTNPATTSWLFRAFGERGLDRLTSTIP